MLDKVRAAMPEGPKKKAVMDILESKRAQMLRGDIHAAAHALDPEYLEFDRSDCHVPLMNMVEKLAPNQVRVRAHCNSTRVQACECMVGRMCA